MGCSARRKTRRLALLNKWIETTQCARQCRRKRDICNFCIPLGAAWLRGCTLEGSDEGLKNVGPLLVQLKVFNTEQMNQAVFAFRRYEDASLRYTGLESHQGLAHYGLYDTVVAKD